MPKKMHDSLKKQARKKGLKGKRAKKYIYGTMKKAERKIKRGTKGGAYDKMSSTYKLE